jgi:hypothetical protein
MYSIILMLYDSKMCAYLDIFELPNDVNRLIFDYLLKNFQFLSALKTTCKSMYKAISVFTIAKLMLSNKLGLFSFRELCINPECYEDTYDVFTFIHNYYYTRYLHYKQYALNTTTIIVNAKCYNIHSHYCCECFKKFVLVGSNSKAIENYQNCEQVNVVF